MKYYYFLAFLFLFFQVNASNAVVDSLEKRLSTTQKTSEKLEIMSQIGTEYLYSDLEKVMKIATELRDLAIQSKNSNSEAASYTLMGNYYFFKNEYSKGLEFYQKSLLIHKKNKNEKEIATDYLNIGNIYESMGKVKEALEAYLYALKIDEKSGDKERISDDYTNLGIFYSHIDDLDKALAYYQKAFSIDIKLTDQRRITTSYINLGTIYYYRGDLPNSVLYHEKALKIAEKINFMDALGKITNNLAELHIEAKDYPKALESLNKSIEIKKKTGNQEGLATAFLNIAQVYFLQKKNIDAIQFAELSKEISTKLDYKSGLIDAVLLLSKVYNAQNDYKKGFEFYKQYAELNSSVLNSESVKQLAELNVRYETEKKEQQLALMKKENANKALKIASQKSQIWVTVFSSLLLISMLVIFYLNYRQKQKKNLAKQMLEEQALRYSSVVKAQETEKMRIARDLHDGVCQKFAATKLKFSNLNEDIGIYLPEKAVKYKDCIRLLDEATSELRKVAHEIMPPALQQHNLPDALKYLCSESFESNLKYTYEVFGLPRNLGTLLEINLYRIAQELVANVIKHAGASEVAVQLLFTPTRVSLHVEDNGNGVNQDKIKGVGINNITIRAQMMNGKFNLVSGPNEGTIASILVETEAEPIAVNL